MCSTGGIGHSAYHDRAVSFEERACFLLLVQKEQQEDENERFSWDPLPGAQQARLFLLAAITAPPVGYGSQGMESWNDHSLLTEWRRTTETRAIFAIASSGTHSS